VGVPAMRTKTWQFLAAVAVLVGALALAAAIGVSRAESPRPMLPVLLGLMASTLALAAWLSSLAAAPAEFPRLDWGRRLIVIGGVALSLQVAVRLFAVGRFGGNVANFDFGVDRPNMAFAPGEDESFGHLLQGCVSFFLFASPSVLIHHVCCYCGEGFARCAAVVQDVAALCVIVYPVYNTAKRTARTAETFASSTYCSTAAEWCIGFLLGCCLAWLADAVASISPWLRPLPPPLQGLRHLLCALRLLAGLALCAVSVVVAVLTGLSWNRTAERDSSHADELAEQTLVCLALLACLAMVGLAGARGLRCDVFRIGMGVAKE